MNDFLENLILACIVVIIGFVVRFIAHFAIKRMVRLASAKPREDGADLGSQARRVLAKATSGLDERHLQRVTTLGSLLRSVVDVVVVVIVLLTVLALFGIPMAPIIASAGVGGVALGFGAQSLVKDYLSGIFMLTEDQFGVGDLVTIGALTGTVLEVSLRVTKIRDGHGTIWYVRNGEVLTLGNVSQGVSKATVDIPVAITEDPERVQQVLSEELDGMSSEPQWADVLLEEPSVLGVGSMAGGTMTIQVSLMTGPNQQWGAMRVIRERCQRALTAAGIKGPIVSGAGPQ